MEPFSAGVVFASIGSAFKFADLAVRLAGVGSENKVFVRTIHVVREDLDEVSRLLSIGSIREKLASVPRKLSWIRGAVTNTKTALNDIGEAVERVRAEKQATGSVAFETRVRWVFSNYERTLARTSELSICHQQLSNVLSYLASLEDILISAGPPAYHDVTYFDDIITRHRGGSALKSPEDVIHSKRSSSLVEPQGIVQSAWSDGVGVDAKHAPASHSLRHTVLPDVSFLRYGHTCALPSALAPPTTPPLCSLPSTNASAAQSGPVSPHHSFGHDQKTEVEVDNQSGSDPTAHFNDPGTCSSSTAYLPPSQTEERRKDAHRHPKRETLSPGVEENLMCLAAANFQGPVNPFELDLGPDPDSGSRPKSPAVALVSRAESTKKSPKPLGGLRDTDRFSINTDDERDLMHGTKGVEAEGKCANPTGTAPKPRSARLPAERLLPANAVAGSLAPFRALSSGSSALCVDGLEPRKRTTLNAPKLAVSAVELHTWPDTSPQNPYLLLHNQDHRSHPTVSSVPIPETIAQGRSLQPCFAGQAAIPPSLPTNVNDWRKQSQSPKRQSLTVDSRMRSQKRMMALLGSIET